MTAVNDTPPISRREAMAVFARARGDEIEAALGHFGDISAHDLRAPETGLVMVRGRIGGGGAPFNLGEATATRASVELATGEVGHAYALGSDGRTVRLAAICDALFQRDPQRVHDIIVAPIAERLAAADDERAGQTAATKVNFFTMVRGED